MNELVSVIIPVYNVEAYLNQCINSVLNQTYSNLDVILIDDGSTDCSGGICDVFAKNDKRVTVIHQKNRGLAGARNTGLSVCRGEYITFVDSDDYLPENAIELLMKILDKENAEIVEGKMCCVARKETTAISQIHNCTGRCALELDIPRTTAPGKIYAASLWNDVRFREGIIHEDYQLIYKVVYGVDRYVYTDYVIYYINERIGSITRSGYSDKQLVLLEIDEERIAFFKEREENVLLEHAYTDFYNHLLTLYNESGYGWILQKYRENIKHFIQIKNIPFKTKIRLLVCYAFPQMWK